MSLVCRNLHFSYNGNAILTAVDLEVQKGAFCVLLGRNGSGKTTLLYCLAGLLRPREGSVAIDGLDLATASRARFAAAYSLAASAAASLSPRAMNVLRNTS